MICVLVQRMPLPPHHLLLPVKSRMVYLSGAGLPRLSWNKRPLNRCSSSSSSCCCSSSSRSRSSHSSSSSGSSCSSSSCSSSCSSSSSSSSSSTVLSLAVDGGVQNVRSRWRWMASTRRTVLTTALMTIIVCLSVAVVFVASSRTAMLSPCSVILTTSSASTAPSAGQCLPVMIVTQLLPISFVLLWLW